MNCMQKSECMEAIEILQQLKKIHQHVELQDSNFEEMMPEIPFTDIIPTNILVDCYQMYDKVSIISCHEKTIQYLNDYMINEWGEQTYKIINPILLKLTNSILLHIIFDFTDKFISMFSGNSFKINSFLIECISMYISYNCSGLFDSYVLNVCMIATHYNGNNCNLTCGSKEEQMLQTLKQMNNPFIMDLISQILVSSLMQILKNGATTVNITTIAISLLTISYLFNNIKSIKIT